MIIRSVSNVEHLSDLMVISSDEFGKTEFEAVIFNLQSHDPIGTESVSYPFSDECGSAAPIVKLDVLLGNDYRD
jgi:hypothetical protein